MIQAGEYRNSDSPYINRVWHARMVGKGQIILPAKSGWDLMVVKNSKGINVIIAGPRSHATVTSYDEDSEYIGVEFKVGVYFQPFRATSMVNNVEILSGTSRTLFRLDGTRFEFPTYENVELFVNDLLRSSVLQEDEVVRQILTGGAPDISPRTVQRHFLRATGLAYVRYRQISRAQNAAQLLKSGMPAIEIAYDLGYSDQFHLSRSLRTLIGQTPTQIKLSFE